MPGQPYTSPKHAVTGIQDPITQARRLKHQICFEPRFQQLSIIPMFCLSTTQEGNLFCCRGFRSHKKWDRIASRLISPYHVDPVSDLVSWMWRARERPQGWVYRAAISGIGDMVVRLYRWHNGHRARRPQFQCSELERILAYISCLILICRLISRSVKTASHGE